MSIALALQLDVGVLGRGDEEELVDESLQPRALLDGHVEQLRALLVGHAAVEPVERVHRTEHHRERRAQLVRHRGDEVALLAVEVDLAGEGDRALLVQQRVRDDERGVVRERGEGLDPALRAPEFAGAVAEHERARRGPSFSCSDDTTTALRAPGASRATSAACAASTSRSPTRCASATASATARRRREALAVVVGVRAAPLAVGAGRAAQRGDAGAERPGLRRERPQRVVERDEAGGARRRLVQALEPQVLVALRDRVAGR